MKILFPIGSFYPTTYGGPGTILYWHGVYLKKNDISPTFVTTTLGVTEPIESNQFLNRPCGIVYYGKGSVLNMRTIKVMVGEVKKTDIIHLTSLFSPLSILCFLYALLFYPKKPVVWSVRGELNVNALTISRVKKIWLLKLYKVTALKVVFASTSAKETSEIKAVFNNKIIEIPNVMPKAKKINRNITDKRFLYLGRIHPIKNIESLIEGFCNSKAYKESDTFLDIAGNCDKRDFGYLESLKGMVAQKDVNNKISFLGHIAGEAKEQLLADAYFMILPSHSENFGNVVIEALSQGTPVIASNNTPWKELEDYNCGYWIENSPSTIANTLDETINLDETSYINIRTQSVRLVNEKYSIDTRIHDWIDEYKLVLK